MIRINLLPVKQIKQRIRIRNLFFCFIISFLVVLAGIGLSSMTYQSKIDNLKVQIVKLEKKKKSLDKIATRIETLKKQKADFNKKIEIIRKLKKDSQKIIRVLDEISILTASKKVYLTSIALQGSANKIKLQGIALDNLTVSEYMKRINQSKVFADHDPTLHISQKKEESGKTYVTFGLTLTVK